MHGAAQPHLTAAFLADGVTVSLAADPAGGCVLREDVGAAFCTEAGPVEADEYKKRWTGGGDVVVARGALVVAVGYAMVVEGVSLNAALERVAAALTVPVWAEGSGLAEALPLAAVTALLRLEAAARGGVSDLSALAGGCPREWMWVAWARPGGVAVAGRGRLLEITRLRADPRMAYVTGMVSAEEAAHIISRVEEGELLKPSKVVTEDREVGGKTQSADRTSWSCKISVAQDATVRAVMQRAAYLTGLTPQHAEPAQVVHYDHGQEFRLHHDYFDTGGDDSHLTGCRGNRLVSFFVYLNECDGGGKTCFPELGEAFSPKRGAAVCWYNIDRTGALDPRTLHAGEPVARGEKYGMNLWLRERQKNGEAAAPGLATCAACGDLAGPIGLCMCPAQYTAR